MTKKIIEILSFISILGGSITFGFLGKPTEMGIMIVAGSISFAFVNIDKFKRIKGAGFEAEFREKVETIVAKQTEPLITDKIKNSEEIELTEVDPNTRIVLNALHHPVYIWRNLYGIQKDAKLSDSEVINSINWLESRGYVSQTTNKYGKSWSMTDSGRYLSARLDFEPV